jgi:hypothetical protein
VHHSFDTEHARLYGLPEAVLIYNFRFWIEKNRANGENLREGRTWTYNSVRALGDLFVYLSPKQIRRALESLVSQGVLVAANHNKAGTDRTLWYAFDDEGAFLDVQHHLPAGANGPAHSGAPDSPKGANGRAQSGKSLISTDINADGKPDTAAGASATKGARLPDDWVLPRPWGVWCKENPDLQGDWTDDHIRLTAVMFRNYWVAKPGRDAVKRDWFATWQNWCLNPKSAPGKVQAGSAGPWQYSTDTALVKANEVGVGPALPGESKDTWFARIRAAIDNGGKPPVARPLPVTPVDPVPSTDGGRAAPSDASRAALAGAAALLKSKQFGASQ